MISKSCKSDEIIIRYRKLNLKNQYARTTSISVFRFHKVGGHTRDRFKTERPKLKQHRPRYPDFKSQVSLKLSKHWIQYFP